MNHERRILLTKRIYSLMLDIYDAEFYKEWEVILLKLSKKILNFLNLRLCSLDRIEESLIDVETMVISFRQKEGK